MLANWAYVENSTINGLYDLLPKNWKNISGLDKSKDDLVFLRSLGWYPVIKDSTVFNSNTHFIKSYNHVVDSETESVIEEAVLEAKPPVPEPEPPAVISDEELNRQLLEQVRSNRNNLLRDSDWTQLTDSFVSSPEKKQAWATYRQALRDLPSIVKENNLISMDQVQWPSPPESA